MNTEHRAKTPDLCMSDAMPFQQHFEYRTQLPLKDIINERFFLPCGASLRPGDRIAVVRYDGPVAAHHQARVVEFVSVRVIAKSSQAIELLPEGEIINVPKPAEPAPAPKEPNERYVKAHGKVKWNPGKQKHEVIVNGEAVCALSDKEMALAVARGDEPIPESEPEMADA